MNQFSKSFKIIECPICGEHRYKLINDTTFKCTICETTYFACDNQIEHELKQARLQLEIPNYIEANKIYRHILDKTTDNKIKVMCYLGRLLSFFGVKYVKDYDGKTKITISKYDPHFKSIKDCSYCKEIEKTIYKDLYEEQLDKIDEEYKKLELELKDEKEYDLFICTKIRLKTTNNPNIKAYTYDYIEAENIYNRLKKDNPNIKIFLSEKELSGIKYDAQIYKALIRSKRMLVIATSREYLESPWVEREWRTWIDLIEVKSKREDSLYFYTPIGCNIEIPLDFMNKNIHRYENPLAVIDKIEEDYLLFNKSNDKEKIASKTLEEEIKELKVVITLGDYEEAEKKIKDLCIKFLNDYRPWLLYIDLLIEQGIPKEDKRYTRFLDQALLLCENNSEKIIIQNKYCKKNNDFEKVKNAREDQEFLEDNKTEVEKKYAEIKENISDKNEIFINNDGKPDEIKDKTSPQTFLTEKNQTSDNDDTSISYAGIQFSRQGDKYYEGVGVSKDYKKAFGYYETAADFGNRHAQYRLGLCYMDGKGVAQDYEEARKWLEKSYNQGFVYAKNALDKLSDLSNNVLKKNNIIEKIEQFTPQIKKENKKYSIGLKYDLSQDNQSYIVTGVGTCKDKNIIIPEEYNNRPVTGISRSAFEKCTSLQKITIPDSITNIGSYAFGGCTSLQEITIPDSVRHIGIGTFKSCTSLQEITIPDSVTNIGYSAFYECKSLQEITIPDSVIYIGESAFSYCKSLTNITIPNSVTSIGNSACQGCNSFTSITIPNSVKSIGGYAFRNCTSLKNVIIPDSVTSMGEDVFWGCPNLTIYCEAKSKLLGWDKKWNPNNRPVIWDLK